MSTDGGDSFSQPASVATIKKTFDDGGLPKTSSCGFDLPHFEHASFRIEGFATICTGLKDNIVVAWPDMRDGVSRIYYNYSANGGKTWLGPSANGQPLLTGSLQSESKQHDFAPQLISTPSGEIGCAFYEFGTKGSMDSHPYLIDVVLAISTDNGKTFSERVTVTDHPWDPAVDAPWAHGDRNVTFIGDYFGFDASKLGFFPLWTDTRTGIQEIFAARVNEV